MPIMLGCGGITQPILRCSDVCGLALDKRFPAFASSYNQAALTKQTWMPVQTHLRGKKKDWVSFSGPDSICKSAVIDHHKQGESQLSSKPGIAPCCVPSFKFYEHQWVYDQQKLFVANDVYWAKPQQETDLLPVVMGDGWLPLEFTSDTEYKFSRAPLKCSFNMKEKPLVVASKLVFYEQKEGGIRYSDNSKSWQCCDKRQNMVWIVCLLPPTTTADLLVKHSSGSKFLVGDNLSESSFSAGSEGWHVELSLPEWPMPEKLLSPHVTRGGARKERRVVFCLCPIRDVKSSRWLIEWFEYHKAIGISHVHVYNKDLGSLPSRVLHYYAELGFITLHDWSTKLSGGLTDTAKSYESGKYHMLNDCYIRNRGFADYIVQGDVDELVYMPEWEKPGADRTLEKALQKMDEIRQTNSDKIAYNIDSRSILPVANENVHPKIDLILNQAIVGDKMGLPGFNNGKYHKGRQKYFLWTGDHGGDLRWLWVHAVSFQHKLKEKFTHMMDQELVQVRHYQGHWYNAEYKIADIFERGVVWRPLPDWIQNEIKAARDSDPILKKLSDDSPTMIDWGYKDYAKWTFQDSKKADDFFADGPIPANLK